VTFQIDYLALAPEIIVVSTMILVLALDLILPRAQKYWTATAAVAGTAMALVPLAVMVIDDESRSMFDGSYVVDEFALVLKGLFIVAAYVVFLMSHNYIESERYYQGEYYFLLLASLLGSLVMASSRDLIIMFIGIELVNPGHEFGYRPFPEAQTAALVELARDIVRRHAIPARNVVGHSDVAPRRKVDPGELFDWPRLAAAGVGLWPEESDDCIMDPDVVRDMLADFGYETENLFNTLQAFQRHFRPVRVNGRVDFESVRLLKGLLELIAVRH